MNPAQVVDEIIDDPALSTPEQLIISNHNQSTTEIITVDIGNVLSLKSTIDDFTKKQLLENYWKPPIGYHFPYSSHTKIELSVKDFKTRITRIFE